MPHNSQHSAINIKVSNNIDFYLAKVVGCADTQWRKPDSNRILYDYSKKIYLSLKSGEFFNVRFCELPSARFLRLISCSRYFSSEPTSIGSFSVQTFTYVLFLCLCQFFPVPIGFFLVRTDKQSACYFRHIITSGRFYVLPVVPVYLRMVLFLPDFLLTNTMVSASSFSTFQVSQSRPWSFIIFFWANVGFFVLISYSPCYFVSFSL